jgi:hypothetical protein
MPELMPLAIGQPGRFAVERRAAPRYRVGALVCCRPAALAAEAALAALLTDVSSGGVGLVLRYQFAPGTLLFLDLSDLTMDGQGPLLARVVHNSPRPGGRWLHGCALHRPLNARQLQACRAAAAD